MNYEQYLSRAIEAAQKACDEILTVYHSNDFQAEAKGDASPLTLADRKAHHKIEEILQPMGLPILSEEGKSIPFEERSKWEYFWLVDPLDGTKEFIKRNGEFTVNIALIYKSKPVIGVVAVPVTGEVFYSSPEGVFLLKNGITTPLKKRPTISLSQPGLKVVASRSHMDQETTDFINKLAEPSLVSKGSSLKFMLLANGEADVYPRFAPTMEWDTAAAHAIVNRLGLKVLKKGSADQELEYNKKDLLNPHFLVY